MKYELVIRQGAASAIGIALAVVLNTGFTAEEPTSTESDATATQMEDAAPDTTAAEENQGTGDSAAAEEVDTRTLADDTVVLSNLYTSTNGSNWSANQGWQSAASVCDWQGVACNQENSRVEVLSLGGRNLVGELPAQLGELTALKQLVLNDNELTGPIPAELANLKKLEDLELDDNRLTGTVPEGFSQLSELKILNLQKNRLTGNIGELAGLAQTADVDFGVNGLYSKGNNLEAQLGSAQTLDAKIVNVSVDRRYADVTWEPVSYKQAGGYIVEFSDANGVAVSKEINSKDANNTQVEGLRPGFTYEVDVRSYTDVHVDFQTRTPGDNKNRVESDGELFDANIVTMLDSDADGDGVGDTMEGAHELPPRDTDGDGIPDFQDPDDDNDGILSKNEFDGDTDGDGIPNRLDDDDDGDGVPTQDERPVNTDTDDDDKVNYLDADDDGDGIPTLVERYTDAKGNLTDELLDLDTDGDNHKNYLDADDDNDGILTIDEPPPLNENENDVLDYLEKIATQGDSGEQDDGLESVVTSRGGGALGSGLLFLALTGLMRQARGRQLSKVLALSLVMISVPVAADNHGGAMKDGKMMEEQGQFGGLSDERSGRFYVGLGAGFTKLDPETRNSSHSIDDGNDFGLRLVLGYEITEHVAVELFGSQLGEAELTPAATVDYENAGLGIAYNFTGKAGGFTPILHLGLNRISNSSRGVLYTRDEDYLGYAGLSLQHEFSNAFALRGQIDYFAEDAQLLSLGVIKHFGGTPPAPIIVKQPAVPPVPVIVKTEPVITQAPAPAPAPAPAIQPVLQIPDSDGDGVSDIGDKCPNSPPGARIDVYGCAKFQGVLQGVNFEYDSAALTRSAMVILDEVAAELTQFPKIKVEVQAHTDSKGRDSYNQRLSERRARSVVDYLGKKGVGSSRLIPVGYGERRPIATNNTDTGRAKNRRVEFQVR